MSHKSRRVTQLGFGLSPKVAAVKRPMPDNRTTEILKVNPDGPWRKYKDVYETTDFGGLVIIAHMKEAPHSFVHIRQLRSADSATREIKQYKHTNLVSAIEAFLLGDDLYLVCEESRILLDYIVSSPKFPDEQQFGAILSQVLDALIFLFHQRLLPTDIDCKKIFLNEKGIVKLDLANFNMELKKETQCNEQLKIICLMLMQKNSGPTPEGKHWDIAPQAFEFLASLTDHTLLIALRRHTLFKPRGTSDKELDWASPLLALISVAGLSLQRQYKIRT